MDNGIPVEIMANNKLLGDFLINTFLLGSGETFGFYGWTNGKTRTHVKLTRCLFIIEVYDANEMKYAIKKDGRLSRYWFRASKKKDRGERS